jgi:hypothetical protein
MTHAEGMTSSFTRIAAGAALLLALTGCGAKVEDPTATGATPITISGSLSGATLSVLESDYADLLALGAVGDSSTILAVTEYSVRCTTLTGTPKAGEGTCDSSGNFSLTIDAATDQPLGCFIMKAGAIAAVVAFQGTTTGMDGNPVREGAWAAGSGSSGVSFGTITVDLTTQKATVVKSAITGATPPTTASGTFADITGNWTIGAPTSTPSGYATVCPAGTSNCDGPMVGMILHLRNYKAVDSSSVAHYGLSIWETEAAFTGCTSGGGGEGADLPAGWVAQTTATTTAAQLTQPLTITHGFPAPTGISAPSGFCGAGAGVTTCDQIVAPGWGFSTAGECQFYCAQQSLWNTPYGACMGKFEVDWNGFGTALNATNTSYSGGAWTGITADTVTDPDAILYLGGKVKFKKQPKQRFMFNELIVSGTVGTLMDQETDNRTICISNGTGGCSSNPTCTVIRSNKLTITQTSATTADVELFQKASLAPGANAACASDSQLTNEMKESKWFFKLTK